jgi:uncharacterized repeat protein (TIGR03803 family)
MARGALAEGADGKLYGTTSFGGPNNGWGTIFRLETNGQLTNLVSFKAPDGQAPQGGLVLGLDGAFYGTTGAGGTSGKGTVFRVTTNGALTTLCSFNSTNGANPYGELVRGDDGNFYGTTQIGGSNTSQSPYGTGFGTVFRVTPLGELTSLASFQNTNGANPWAGLAKGSDGNFYGTTSAGGDLNDGTLFQLTSAGVLNSLHTMRADIEGSFVLAGLTQGTDGRFYGTSAAGGQIGAGAIFRMSVPLAVGQTLTVTNGSVRLGWKTVVGRSYQVQWSSELTANNWSNLGPAISATSGYTNMTEPLSTGTLKRYYRVITMQ